MLALFDPLVHRFLVINHIHLFQVLNSLLLLLVIEQVKLHDSLLYTLVLDLEFKFDGNIFPLNSLELLDVVHNLLKSLGLFRNDFEMLVTSLVHDLCEENELVLLPSFSLQVVFLDQSQKIGILCAI